MSVSPVLRNTIAKLLEDFFLTTSQGIKWDISFIIYKEACAKAYTVENIKAAFKLTRNFPPNPRVVLSQFSKPIAKSRSDLESQANTTCIPT